MKTMIKYLMVIALVGVFSTAAQAKNSKICVDHNGKTISVSVNAVPAFVKKGAIVGCTVEEQTAFAWFLQSNPSSDAIVSAASDITSVVESYESYQDLVSEYQQYQDATVEEEGEFDESEEGL